jgi:hypothetical protein
MEAENANDSEQENDDITVNTATTATKTDFIEQEMEESILRFEIPYRNGHASNEDFKLHSKLLQLLLKAYDDTELRIYDNRNQRISEVAGDKWFDQEYHESHFKTYDDDLHRKTCIAHRILAKKPLAQLKREPTILAFLKKSKTYLRAHFWKEDELAIKDIGFLISYVPSKHSKSYVINDMIERADLFSTAWQHVPQFKLVQATPKVKLSGRQKPINTMAYSIQVLTKDAKTMNQFLRTIYGQDHYYIPYNMKKTSPEIVAKAMVAQNQIIAGSFVVVVVGVSRETMTELKPILIQSSHSIRSVSDTSRTDKQGRWFIIVEEKGFQTTRKYIAANLKTWIQSCPPVSQISTPEHFPPAQVSQKSTDADDDSSGHASYMSSCAQSYGSVEDLDAAEPYFYAPTTRPFSASYADVVKQQAPIPPHQPTGTEIEFSATDRELRAIIASLQQEVHNLKNELPKRNPSTPSTVTEVTTPDPETQKLAKRMDAFETNMSQWMNEMTDLLQHRPTSRDMVVKQPNHTKRYTSPPRNTHYASPATLEGKRHDHRLTPERGDPMNTQPTDDDNRHFRQDREGYTRTTRGYDPNEPEQLYLHNGDGSLYHAGQAGPGDYDANGVRRGGHHSNYTHHLGPPSPQRNSRTGTGSHQSLSAARAQTYHA